jgi:hypothetical protein
VEYSVIGNCPENASRPCGCGYSDLGSWLVVSYALDAPSPGSWLLVGQGSTYWSITVSQQAGRAHIWNG